MMLTARPSTLALIPPFDHGYTGFSNDEGVRSPRTPTYSPDCPLTGSLPPFDHTRILGESSTQRTNTHMSLPPHPEEPLVWIWICHLCHSRYPLGVTRRCLVDGHYYCSGDTNQPNLRKKKKRQSCSSEFDYVAWKEWADWQRNVLKLLKKPRLSRGCANCLFPSQCRYHTEVQNDVFEPDITSTISKAPAAIELAKPEQEMRVVNGKTRELSTSNETISFDQILNDIFTGEKATKPESNQDISKTKGHGKRRNSRKGLIPSLEEEMDKEAERVKQLVGADLWNNLEDIDLEKRKVG